MVGKREDDPLLVLLRRLINVGGTIYTLKKHLKKGTMGDVVVLTLTNEQKTLITDEIASLKTEFHSVYNQLKDILETV